MIRRDYFHQYLEDLKYSSSTWNIENAVRKPGRMQTVCGLEVLREKDDSPMNPKDLFDLWVRVALRSDTAIISVRDLRGSLTETVCKTVLKLMQGLLEKLST